MGDPRNPARWKEEWDADRLAVLDEEAKWWAQMGTISGGWAWHYMSPNHVEYKMLHDHKDIDVFIPPQNFSNTCVALLDTNYEKIWTRFGKHADSFHRYQKYEMGVKVLVDVFIAEPKSVTVNGISVVEPETLLSYYKKKIHSTDDCIAVQRARELLQQGISPVMNNELITLTRG